MAGRAAKGRALRAANDQFKGYRQMMGVIVLSMLLSWFGVVAALTIWSGRSEERMSEEPTRTTGAPQLASDESQSGIGA
jgi:hypothetical protein